MDEIAFSDWPGQPVDLSGNNSWIPAYGFQPSHALLEQDFVGNPDADLFLHGSASQNYMYLETIQEETSDDLRSESDLSDSTRASPQGWLATDSETGSVIRLDRHTLQETVDSGSERDLACPAKRRRQELTPTVGCSDEESLSRSSSLLQFETLEKQCQDISSSSPSILSSFSFDSLERKNNKDNLSPDSLDRINNSGGSSSNDFEPECDFYKTFKIDLLPNRKGRIRNSGFNFNSSDSTSSSDSSDSSSRTLEIFGYDSSCKSMNRLSRSFENLNLSSQKYPKEKLSSENLSEDSGYSDHLTSFMKLKSSSISNLDSSPDRTPDKENPYKSFWSCGKSSHVNVNGYYDTCHFREQNFASNFGSSCQDLSVLLDKCDFRSPLIERFAKRRLAKFDLLCNNRSNCSSIGGSVGIATRRPDTSLILEDFQTKYKHGARSEPNLHDSVSSLPDVLASSERSNNHHINSYYFENDVDVVVPSSSSVVSSVPKDLNFVGFSTDRSRNSIAIQNCDIADLKRKNAAPDVSKVTLDFELDPHIPRDYYEVMSTYKREGSYDKAMQNRIDVGSDDELPPLPKSVRKSTIVDFDRKVLKTISENSLRSLTDSNPKLNNVPYFDPIPSPISNCQKRNVKSTPNLAECEMDVTNKKQRRQEEDVTQSSHNLSNRKNSLTKSFSGSTNSKGVHFCPVVSEVNWRDRSESTTSSDTGKESTTYSISSSTPDLLEPQIMKPLPLRPKVVSNNTNEKQQQQQQQQQHSVSEPDLFDSEERREIYKHMKELLDFDNNRSTRGAISQPNLHEHSKRRTSVIKKDVDGSTIRAYIDTDGIAYKHTHLVDLATPSTSVTTVSTKQQQKEAKEKQHQQHQQQQQQKQSEKRREAVNYAMDSVTKNRHQRQQGSKSSRAGSKLGGFFSRLASFRFSNKNKKNSSSNNGGKTNVNNSTQQLDFNPPQRVAKKEDYIYIPLKGPTTTTTTEDEGDEEVINTKKKQQQQQQPQQQQQKKTTTKKNNKEEDEENSLKVMSGGVGVGVNKSSKEGKPPLPKLPPRVVGASAKRQTTPTRGRHDGGGVVSAADATATTIDSGVALPRPMEPMGLIETDLDTEVTVITSGAHAKTRSLMNLGGGDAPPRTIATPQRPDARPHKSMEFLLDKQNLKVVEPPENELQKGERVMSEHQLRIQRSLQKLTIPEWYKQSEVPQEGFLLRKNSANASVRERWTGTSSSRTPSLTSITPVIVSPTPNHQYSHFVRWSTSKINSTASSPCASTRSSFNARQHHVTNGSVSPCCSLRNSFNYRQPYMGWRSQERLVRPRTPAERLASSLLTHNNDRQQEQQQQQESPEIQTSIKEVTSAIVHYVSGLRPEEDRISSKSLSTSPRGSQKLCWLESSFVGSRPLDSPQTPVTFPESHPSTSGASSTLRLDLHNNAHNEVTAIHYSYSREQRPSPNSTTLEDVLDSLLGLPPSTRAPSPSLAETASVNTSPGRLGEESKAAEHCRRHSEGSDTTSTNSKKPFQRRISFDSTPVVRCRYNRCGKTYPATSSEAGNFKNCHNCSYTYCSRQCRRAHWEKHRKICLYSRIGSLCRQVLTSVKENPNSLLQISLVARRGYLATGSGAVKCFFPCPEKAEKFLVEGLAALGDLTYVSRTDLLPSEMGSQMYTEIMKMCKNYNPDTKLVVYVSVCVTSEAPTTGSVKWERQLVSRCAKMRLSKKIPLPGRDVVIVDVPDTYIFTCVPTFDEKIRQVVVEKLINELALLGVNLEKKYKDVHEQLQSFATRNFERFFPITIYPYVEETAKCFMCIVMLDAEPDSVRQVAAAGVQATIINLL